MSAVHATQLHLSTRGLVLPNGLRIASVDIDLPTPVVQIKPQLYVPEGTSARVAAVIEAEDLQTYLRSKSPSGVTDIAVTAEEGFLIVTGYARMVVPVQIGAKGILEYSDRKLNFSPVRAEVGGVKMPEGLVREKLDEVNPIIDLTGYPLDAEVHEIALVDGKIRLLANVTATAPIPRLEP